MIVSIVVCNVIIKSGLGSLSCERCGAHPTGTSLALPTFAVGGAC